jgi:hypothetical protein
MKRLLLALCCLVGASGPTSSQVSGPGETDNVVAFARLYGAVRYFYPGDATTAVDWNAFAVMGVSRVRSAPDAAALETALEGLFLPLGPGIEIGPSLSPAPAIGAPDGSLVAWRYVGAAIGQLLPGSYRVERTNRPPVGPVKPANERVDADAPPAPDPRAGDHVDIDLGRGLRARVALALSNEDAQRRPDPAALGGLVSASARALPTRDADPAANMADVVVAWNVFRHFYPYWPDLTGDPKVDWDAVLAGHLRAAAAATTRVQQRDALRRLVADAHDGHGGVRDLAAAASAGALPIAARLIEGRIAVTSSTSTAVPVGAVITAIGGEPAAHWLEDRLRLASGTEQWKVERTLRLWECELNTTVELAIDDGSRPRSVSLPCGAIPKAPLPEKRPDPVAELSPALWYVDLTRATMAQIEPSLARLAEARGVIFDLRGYPTDAGAGILAHLLSEPEHDRWMHIDRLVGPFGRIGGVVDLGWDESPKAPRIAARRVFLTDGRAISYAESVMGYIADRRLATIIGAPTAGTNGNVAMFEVPGGFRVGFTGMRVTRHDGTSRRHLIGIAPDVPLVPTLDGLRRGRDELLEQAIVVINRPPSPAAPAK